MQPHAATGDDVHRPADQPGQPDQPPQAGPQDQPPDQVPLGRAAAAALAATCGVQAGPVRPVLLMPVLMLVLAVVCLVPLLTRRRGVHARQQVVLGVVVAVGVLGVLTNAGVTMISGVSPWAVVPLALVMVVAAPVAVWGDPARSRAGLLVLLAAFTVLATLRILHAEVLIDVGAFLRGGIHAMLHGTSPYAITIENPYDAAGTRAFYGPGVVVDGIVQYGFPYLPTSLLLDLPAYLLGDPRWMHLAAVLLATGLAWRMATDRLGRAVAVLLVCGSTTTTVVLDYWVEPLMAALIVVTVLAMRAGRTWAAVPLGLLFASKQYAVSYVPALVSVARSLGWRTVGLAAAVGAVVLLPFVAWDPHAFVRSAVELQFVQPFRDDAVSLLPGLKALLGGIPEWATQVSPVVGLIVSALVAWRTRPGPTAFAIGVGLSLLVTVLTSKIGFMNYYYFITAAFVVATVSWADDDPVASDRPTTGRGSDARAVVPGIAR